MNTRVPINTNTPELPAIPGSDGGGGIPDAHANSHKHGGTDEVAVSSPSPNGIVKADASGKISDGWIPASVARVPHTHARAEIVDFPQLATVAETGDYGDLLGLPDILGESPQDGKIYGRKDGGWVEVVGGGGGTLTAPDGGIWQLVVDNDGVLGVVKL